MDHRVLYELFNLTSVFCLILVSLVPKCVSARRDPQNTPLHTRVKFHLTLGLASLFSVSQITRGVVTTPVNLKTKPIDTSNWYLSMAMGPLQWRNFACGCPWVKDGWVPHSKHLRKM